MGNEDFKSWISFELSGYPSEIENLPDYRILRVNSKGHFSGAFGSALNNADMLLYTLPEKIQKLVSKAYFFDPIAVLESLTDGKSEVLTENWNSMILAKYGNRMYDGYNCMEAWKLIPTSGVIGIIDTVKTKILNFALEIELLNPQAGEAALGSNPIPQEKVNQVFNFNIAGNVQNLASGNSHSTVNQNMSSSNTPKEFLEILGHLKASNIENDLANEVARKLEILGASVGTPEYKSLYSEFMGFISNHVTVLGFLAPYIPMLTTHLV